jgi:DNA-binding CsgD family transcriptional regulator
MLPQQKTLLEFPAPPSGTIVVNDRVSIRTEGTHRAIFVQGLVLLHYDVGDRAAEAYATVTLFEAGYADQNDIARVFGCSPRTVRRHQQRFHSGGLLALGRMRGRPCGKLPRRIDGRDRTILRLKEHGLSVRAIAVRLGLSEKAIRKRLRRLGCKPQPQVCLPLGGQTDDAAPTPALEPSGRTTERTAASAAGAGTIAAREPLPTSFDRNPLDRSLDRWLAAMGKLDDALPLFARTENLPGAGVLLAIPALLDSGLLTMARKIYGSLGPAFYGLRTTIVASVLLALLRILRPEALKEHSPGDLGRIVGLDRMPEMKTLRRKFARLAAMKRSRDLGLGLARHRIAERGQILGFLYVDGHVRAYHGKRTIAKAYLTRSRIVGPATTDYWINDPKGDPLFVVTADANAALSRMLVPILQEVRNLIGPDRRLTVVFDRGGWSPRRFTEILALGFDILTYRKGRCRKISERRFVRRKANLEGRLVEYLLHDQAVRFLKGKLRLRQVTRLTESGHQTAVLTSRWDLRDIMVAYRMFERWRQENFFKYMRQEFLIDALVDYQAEPDDPNRSIPNPLRKAVDQELRKARSRFAKLQEQYGSAALDYLEGRITTMLAFTAIERQIHPELRQAAEEVEKLADRQQSLPLRIPLSECPDTEKAMKLSTERKHLSNVLKMVAYQVEGSLVELLRPVYPRTEDEGRTLIQTALRSAATIEPTETELRVTLSPLSSPHRSRAIALVCEELNKEGAFFPGTTLRLRFSVDQDAL